MAKISSNTVKPQIWVEAYHEILFKYALARLRDADLAKTSSFCFSFLNT